MAQMQAALFTDIGQIAIATVERHPPPAGYAVVQVKLDSGVRFFSNMPGMANEDIRIGMRVKGFFDRADRELTLLKFKPEN